MQPYFFIESDRRFIKINFSDIIYFEALRNYVRIVTSKGSHMALLSLRQLETVLPPEKFCRIHRSYIVSIDWIQSFVSDKIYIRDKILPIGERYNKALQQRINIVTSDYLKDCKKLPLELSNVTNSPN